MAQGSTPAGMRMQLQEQWVRAVVREEIARAFGALQRAASDLDAPYDTAELDSRALGNIAQAAENAVRRLTCPHEKYFTWHGRPRCSRCGEPEPELEDPFKEQTPEGKTRQCPVDLACPPLVGWSAFCVHIYEVHTEGDEESRIETADRLLKHGRTAQ